MIQNKIIAHPFLFAIILFQFFGIEKSFSQTVCIQFFNEAYTGGNQPRSIASADFNHDGHIDLVTANWESNNISVLLGNGNGTFASPVNYFSPSAPNEIVTADFDGDGNADVATAVYGGVLVFPGNGDGTLDDSVKYESSLYTLESLTVEDVNNDSIPDIIAGDEFTPNICAFIGNGDGTFAPSINSHTHAGPITVSVADFNNDGWKDVVYTHLPGINELIHFFSVLFGDGSGSFDDEVKVDSIYVPLDAIAVDQDHDGNADVITADFEDDSVSIFYGNGDGTFDLPISYAAYLSPSYVTFADINNDGIGDIEVADWGGNTVAVLPGKNDGTFGAYVFALAAVDPMTLTIGDFNEDGLPDIATATSYFQSAYYAIILNCTTTGIESVADEPFIIYPNPVSSQSTLMIAPKNFSFRGETKIELYDVLGRMILSAEINPHESFTLDLKRENILPGIYFLNLKNEVSDKEIIEKLIVQ